MTDDVGSAATSYATSLHLPPHTAHRGCHTPRPSRARAVRVGCSRDNTHNQYLGTINKRCLGIFHTIIRQVHARHMATQDGLHPPHRRPQRDLHGIARVGHIAVAGDGVAHLRGQCVARASGVCLTRGGR